MIYVSFHLETMNTVNYLGFKISIKAQKHALALQQVEDEKSWQHKVFQEL